MARRQKFRRGPVIRDPVVAIVMILEGRWLYWHERPKSPSVLGSMHVYTIANAARAGILCAAIENEEQK